MIRSSLRLVFFLAATLLFTGSVSSAIFDFMPSDATLPFKGELPQNTYHKYCKNIYSQNGEDGILEQILGELGITHGTFCEFGASNGIDSSNTYNLILNHNFSGIAIESDRGRYKQCWANYKNFPSVKVFHGAVLYETPNMNLDAWLRRGKLPYDFDVLSIDIDSYDYYVWEGLKEFSPKIVIIETNPYRDPVHEELPGRPSKEYNIDPLKEWDQGRVACGCSFISAIRLGLEKGYVPVAYTGNITFVRKDLIDGLKDFPYLLSDDPFDYVPLYTHLVLWGNEWFTNSGLMLNVAIGEYYSKYKSNLIDPLWLSQRVSQLKALAGGEKIESQNTSNSINIHNKDFVVTNPYRTDGFGAQYQTIIYSLIYAELNGLKFVYTPFTSMEHNYDGDPNFLEKKERLINFKENFELNFDVNLQLARSVQSSIVFFESNLNLCAKSQSLKKVKELFKVGKDRSKYFDDRYLNVAVHIRRPNSHDSRIIGADVPDSIYNEVMGSIKQAYNDKPILFHIYSQGDPEYFKQIYNSADIVLHLNESVEDTFSSLVFADILVTSKSSFSYTAAFLSDGVVYYMPFWHPPLPGWVGL